MRCLVVIPARLASTRLNEKLLRRVGGKSILQHTYESAQRASIADGVLIAVDDPRLAAEVERFGGDCRLTSPECQSGTDRIAEIALLHEDVDVFVNVQGDEPEIAPETISQVGQALLANATADIATAACPIRTQEQVEDPNCVKVVTGSDGKALLFSRSPIPYARDGITPGLFSSDPPVFAMHLGIYAYRRDFLLWFAQQPPSRLEQTERLEQLRALEAGKTIVVTNIDESTPGIDTLEDFHAFEERYRSREGAP
ncbi:MAG: 3-deoxy-manno-octulosonate cytidylyltransferase [Planctomycetota bacterium]